MFSPLAFHRRSRFQSILFLSVFIVATPFSFSQAKKSQINISNFGQVNENYYRGGQPDASDIQGLKKLGIKSVIDLQEDGNQQEAFWVQSAGMQYFKIPLTTSRPATAEQTDHFLKLVNDPTNLPVYVHCAAGRHRTGEMTAIYRITHDSWTADSAYDEMKQYGFYAFPNHSSLKKYVYSYYLDFQNAAKKNAPVTRYKTR